MRVLVDTNVILDVLQDRKPWSKDGKVIFYAIANNRIAACITAKEAADIHFFSRKQFRKQENVDSKAREIMSKLFALFEVLDTLGIDCINALAMENGDYEDAVSMETAARSGVDCIVTRNTEHFKTSLTPVFTPAEFIKEYDL